jgi:hypothetical protein
VEVRDGSGNLQLVRRFQNWNVSGTVDLDAGAATTDVTNFQSDVTLTAVYRDEAPPAIYTVTLILPSDDGTMSPVYSYYTVLATDTLDLSAPISTYIGHPPYCTDYYLNFWSVSGSVSFTGQGSNMIHLSNFASDVYIQADYVTR